MRANKRWILFALIGAFSCVVFCAVGYGALWALGSNSLGERENTALTQAEIENIARISIPPSASDLMAEAGGFQDRYIHVRFTLPSSDLETFLSSTSVTLTSENDIPFQEHMVPEADWWQPEQATRLQSGQSFENGISQSVLIDMSDPANYRIYVATFET